MQSLILNNPGSFSYQQTMFDETVREDEVLVKVHCIGICGTDYHAYRGKQPFFSYPRILGHELGVEVIAKGKNVQRITIGDRCSIEPYLNCGTCPACVRSKTNCCENLKVLGVHINGGMQEYIKVPAHKIHVSSILNYEQLALVETLSIGAHAVSRAGIEKQDTVLVIGAGPIGLSVMEFAKMQDVEVVAIDFNEQRLDFCLKHKKADKIILLNDNPVEQLRNQLNGNLPTIIFDATGNPASMMQSFQYVAHGGKLIFVGLFQGDVSFNDPDFHRRELTLYASRNSTSQDFKNIIQCIEAGKIDTTPWISHRIPFAKLIAQFDALLLPDSKVIKAIVQLT
jgi:2-desacetyl-2-hydroxyethyl bacteriochlorophyllide A dehydrogenase